MGHWPSGQNFYRRSGRNPGPYVTHLRIGDGNAALGPVPEPVCRFQPASAIRQAVDHDIAARGMSGSRCGLFVVFVGIGNMQAQMRH